MIDPPQWVDPNPPEAQQHRTTVILTVTGALLVLLVVSTLVGVVLNRKSNGGEGAGVDIRLVGANVTPDNPFTPSVLTAPVTISEQAASSFSALLQQIPIRSDRGVRPTSGRTPGLYGTPSNGSACDVVTLANYLDADLGAAGEWASVLGLTPQQIPYYLNTLSPVVLMGDTWVTSYIRDDVGTPYQAVLQAGNAVLVDRLGVPRVHCASGAPLTPPSGDNFSRYSVTGDGWPRFTQQSVLVIKYAADDHTPEIANLTLIDIGTGQQVEHKPGADIDLGGRSIELPDPAAMNVAPVDHLRK